MALLVVMPALPSRTASAAVIFSEGGGTISLTGTTYRLKLSSVNGGIVDILDRTNGDQSLLADHGTGCLWLAVFPTVEEQVTLPDASTRKLTNTSGCDFNRDGNGGLSSVGQFTPAWNAGTSTLTLTYAGAYKAGREVAVTVAIVAADASFDIQVTSLVNRWNAPMRNVILPLDLVFRDSNVERVYAPFRLPGIRLNREYFKDFMDGCQHVATYPGGDAFADYMHLQLSTGHLAMYGIAPTGPAPVAIGFVDAVLSGGSPECSNITAQNPRGMRGPNFKAYHSYHTVVEHGDPAYTSPTVRFRIGQQSGQDHPMATARQFRDDTGIAGYDALGTKLGAQLFDEMKRALVIKVDISERGKKFDDPAWRTTFRDLPKPSVLHPVAFQKGGHDNNYPDFQEIDPCWGNLSDFRTWVADARSSGIRIMPYINPTWWDYENYIDEGETISVFRNPIPPETVIQPRTETFRANPVDPVTCRSRNDKIDRKGWVVSPFAATVDSRLASVMNSWGSGVPNSVPVDLLFEDQIGARAWIADENTSRPTAVRLGYARGWLTHAQRYRGEGHKLMTERGWDRLARDMVGFHGSLLELDLGLDEQTKKEKISYANANFGPANWGPYPLATWMFGDKVLFYQHDLATKTMIDVNKNPIDNARALNWNLSLGTMLSYHLRDVGGFPGEGPGTRWLDLAASLQRLVASREAGADVLQFTDSSNAQRVGVSQFPGLTVVTDWDAAVPYTLGEHTIAPEGFLATATDGSVTAGRLRRFHGADLTDGDHYLIEERSPSLVRISQPVGTPTPIEVDRPSGAPGALAVWAVGRGGQRLGTIQHEVLSATRIRFAYNSTQPWGEVGAYEIVAGEACNPRPRVAVTSTRSDSNTISVTVTAGAGTIQSINFTGDQRIPRPNAVVESPTGATPRAAPFLYTPNGSLRTVSFVVRRSGPGAVTVPFEVSDACTPWRTFVGFGS